MTDAAYDIAPREKQFQPALGSCVQPYLLSSWLNNCW